MVRNVGLGRRTSALFVSMVTAATPRGGGSTGNVLKHHPRPFQLIVTSNELLSEENVGGFMGIGSSGAANLPTNAAPLILKPTGILQQPTGSDIIFIVWLFLPLLRQLQVKRAVTEDYFP